VNKAKMYEGSVAEGQENILQTVWTAVILQTFPVGPDLF